MKKVRLLILEEQQVWREAYRVFFSAESGIEVVEISAELDRESALNKLSLLKPDVVQLGLQGLQAGAMELIEAVRDSYPRTGLVILSASYHPDATKQLREIVLRNPRGCAFLLKSSIQTTGQLIQVIRAVGMDQVVLEPSIMENLIGDAKSKDGVLHELTARELEVLEHMSRGLSNQAIAQALYLGTKTVEHHVNSIYSKLSMPGNSVHHRVQAVLFFLRGEKHQACRTAVEPSRRVSRGMALPPS